MVDLVFSAFDVVSVSLVYRVSVAMDFVALPVDVVVLSIYFVLFLDVDVLAFRMSDWQVRVGGGVGKRGASSLNLRVLMLRI